MDYAADQDPLDVLSGIFDEWWEDNGIDTDDRAFVFTAFIRGYEVGIDRGLEMGVAVEYDRIADIYGNLTDLLWEPDDNEL